MLTVKKKINELKVECKQLESQLAVKPMEKQGTTCKFTVLFICTFV